MAYGATIGIINPDGSVTSIDVQMDGELHETGKVLLENYKTERSFRNLLSMGNIQYLLGDPREERVINVLM